MIRLWYSVRYPRSNDPTEVISYSFSAGRNVQLGITADVIEEWYLRPNVTWRFFKNISLSTGLSYEYGNQGVGDISGGQVETYNWLGGTVGINWSFMKRLSLGLNYRIAFRESDLPDQGYTQNVIGLTLTYRPQ